MQEIAVGVRARSCLNKPEKDISIISFEGASMADQDASVVSVSLILMEDGEERKIKLGKRYKLTLIPIED